MVLDAPFVVLGRIDSEDPGDLADVASSLIKRGFNVLVCTPMKQDEFEQGFSALVRLPVYVLYGEFNEKLIVGNNIQFGVRLGSANQHLVYRDGRKTPTPLG